MDKARELKVRLYGLYGAVVGVQLCNKITALDYAKITALDYANNVD